jgi:fumarate reductase flavoprotein subunit
MSRHDVVVIGGGLAGLTAATRAAELGLRAVVLEQEADARHPCNSRLSGGIFHVAYHEMKQPPAVLHAAIDRATAGEAHPALIDAIASDAGRVVDWLRDHGARFIRGGAAEWERWLLAPPRPLQAGLVWEGRGPDVLLRALADEVVRRGGSIEHGMRAATLEPGVDAITVSAGRGAASVRFEGKTVIIADGGFQADRSLFQEHIGPRPDLVKQRGAANSRGDGLRMAQALGARITGMQRFYGHLLAQEAMTNDRLWPYPQLDALAVAAVIVDRTGQRMLDEGVGGVALANLIAQLEDPWSATIIFDAAIWEGPCKSARIPVNPHVEKGGATVHRAATLVELARALDIDGRTLERTVTDYNQAVRSRRTHALAPARRVDLHEAWPIVRAPFMAIRVCAGITHTMGGLAIDGNGRVLREDGSVIERLYAAGSATGGLEGGGETGGYVGGLCKAAIFGLRSAEHIAKALGRTVNV